MASAQEKRRATLALLIEDYGGGGALESHLGRWALMERDASHDPWWSTGEDWRALLDASANQERPEDWPAERLFDLDSFEGRNGWSTAVALRYVPEDIMPDIADEKKGL